MFCGLIIDWEVICLILDTSLSPGLQVSYNYMIVLLVLKTVSVKQFKAVTELGKA